MKALLSRLRKSRRDAADAAAETPVRRQPGGVSIPKLSIGAFLAATLVVAGTTFVAYSQYAETATDASERQNRLEAQRLADFLAGRIQGYRDLLSGIAARGRLGADDLAAYAAAIPGSPGLRHLPPGFGEPDTAAEPPVSYACIDLVNIGAAGRAAPAEVHLAGQPGAHLVIAVGVGENAGRGTLLLTFAPSIIERWAAPLTGSGGFVELRQGANGSGPLLTTVGNAALRSTATPQMTPISGTSWELAYWPEPANATAAEAGYLLLAVIFLLLGVTTSRLVGGDLARFNNHIADLLARKRDHAYSVKLAEFRRAVGELDELFRAAASRSATRPAASRPAASSASAPASVPTSESDSDSPDVVFMNKDAFEVSEQDGGDNDAPPADDKTGEKGG